ncbi:hypothetical protein ABPG74_001274 [Tetrahymena malaccensis]
MGCVQINKKNKMIIDKQYFNELDALQNLNYQIYFIIEINLSHNYIGDQGVFDLSVALSECVNLTILKLDLISNIFFDEGIINFASGILKCPRLKILMLHINNNRIQRKLKLRNKILKAKRLVKYSISY